MKKKLVAVLLSLTMCMSMVVQTGAAALDDGSSGAGDISAAEPFEPEISVPSDSVDGPGVEDPQQEQGQIPEMPETPGESELPLESQISEEDLLTDSEDPSQAGENIQDDRFLEGEIDKSMEYQAVSGSIVVGPSDWVKVPQGFKLVKRAAFYVDQPTEDNAVQQDAYTEELYMEEPEADGTEQLSEEIPEEEAEIQTLEEPVQQEPETEYDISEEKAAARSDFYTAADGIIQVTTQSVKGSNTGYYLFDENGIMVTGKKTVQPGTPGYKGSKAAEMYFTEESTASLYSNYQGVAKNPVTSDIGQQKKEYWLYQDGKFSFYGKSGENIPVKSMNDKNKKVGYLKINGKYYCLKDDGTPKTGFIGIYGSKYFFDPKSKIPGQMFMGGWRCMGTNEKGEKWIYFNRDNKGEDRGKAVIHNGNVAITITPKSKTVKYLMDHNGYIQKSRRSYCVDKAWYGSDSQGRIVKDKLVRYGKYRYYFTKNGKQVGWKNMWKQCPTSTGPRYYYFGDTSGRVVEKKGWQRVKWPSGKFLGWFYFRDNGDHYKERWVGNQYFDSVGRLASGIKEIDGKTYFFEISNEKTHRGKVFRNTMIKYQNKWYYAESDGQLSNNEWKKINGSWYYFEKFVSVTNSFRWKGRTYGWLDDQGKFCTGWVVLSNSSNKVRYVNPKGNGFYKNTSAVIDGLRYYFDEKAYRINDLTSVYKGPYYVEVDRVNGVMTIYDKSRTVPVKAIRVSVGAPGTETPLGTYTLSRSLRWQPLMGPTWGQYGTHVDGAGIGGIFIHSVSGPERHPYSVPSVEYNKLGNPASHGCIRACVADAKWIYENCNGATIRIFDGAYQAREALKGPLGRKGRVPMRPPYNFDPTDPSI